MSDASLQERLSHGVGGPEVWLLRIQTAQYVALSLGKFGRTLTAFEIEVPEQKEAFQAVGYLLQMAGELGAASSRMLSGKEHYAGAALLRQLVEIEYLMHTFENGHAAPVGWFHSSHEERMKVFSPKKLRSNSKGRFLFKDYQDHCERGGHPVPRGISLLGGERVGDAQILLVDLLCHLWRTWDSTRKWLSNFGTVGSNLVRSKASIGECLYKWSVHDAIYALMVEERPNA